MVKLLKKNFVVVTFCFLFGYSVLVRPTLARPYGPYGYAEFINEPYPIGPNTMTSHFEHDSYSTLYIYLYLWDSIVQQWKFNRYTPSGFINYSASVDGVWRLKCYLTSTGDLYFTDETRDTFGITDPESSQNNLATDWARHPQYWDIYKKALEINNQTTSSYEAAHNIYLHVLDHFPHHDTDYTFRSDLDLLNDLNTYGHYDGVCRSDAVILTSYARALGIPARIIYLYAHWEPNNPEADDVHYFAEFYVLNCSQYNWVPVDGDQHYDWFGITEANQRISYHWSHEVWIGGELVGGFDINHINLEPRIVTRIPCGGIWLEPWYDSGYDSVKYLNHPYRNDL